MMLQRKRSLISTSNTSDKILHELLKLIDFIKSKIPNCEVTISCPTYRFDDPKAQLIINNLRTKLSKLQVPIIENSNINITHVGKKGLHLNEAGSDRLAVNYISHMRRR